jgi:GNAT superfamily N-acetyltransferase
LRDGREIVVRAVRDGDRDGFQAALRRMSEQSRYSRFMSPVKELSPQLLERAIRPDPGRELQLVAVDASSAPEQIVGGARYSAGPGSKDCEFAVAVTDAWQGLGIASHLLEALIRTARERGLERIEGYILASNAGMLRLAGRLGFVPVPSPEGPGVRLVRRDLGNAT